MFALITPVRTVLLATVIFMLAFAVTAPAQTTWYVDDDALPGGAGTAWDTAFKYLQDALGVADSGDEVRVAQGLYKPDRDTDHPDGTGDRTAAFELVIGVGLYGGYAGITEPDPDVRDMMLYQSVLSGDLNGNDGPDFMHNSDNSWNVVIGSGTDPSTVLDGFVIRSGNANIRIGGPLRKCRGGGMWILTGSPTIKNCIFTENSAIFGGGLYNREGSSPLVADCFFTNNRVTDPGGG